MPEASAQITDTFKRALENERAAQQPMQDVDGLRDHGATDEQVLLAPKGGIRQSADKSGAIIPPVERGFQGQADLTPPDKHKQYIPPTERGFQGQARLTPPEKHRQRVHNDDRMKRSIDHLEQTGNFRKETLDKMRRATQQQQAPSEAAQNRAQILQLQKSYDKAMADLDRQRKQLRAEYKAQMNALKNESAAKPAVAGQSQSIGGGTALGGGMGRDNSPHRKLK